MLCLLFNSRAFHMFLRDFLGVFKLKISLISNNFFSCLFKWWGSSSYKFFMWFVWYRNSLVVHPWKAEKDNSISTLWQLLDSVYIPMLFPCAFSMIYSSSWKREQYCRIMTSRRNDYPFGDKFHLRDSFLTLYIFQCYLPVLFHWYIVQVIIWS